MEFAFPLWQGWGALFPYLFAIYTSVEFIYEAESLKTNASEV
jgi:hypothetical protein